MKKGIRIAIITIILFVMIFMIYLLSKPIIYDVSSELGNNGKILEKGKIEGKNYEQIIEDFTSRYPTSQTEKNYFIFGDINGLTILSYEKIDKGVIDLALGKMIQKTELSNSQISLQKLIPLGDNVKIILDGEEYNFKINRNQIAYMVVSQDE